MTAPSFPMSVKSFLALREGGLNRGDIVLTRSRTLSSRAIRWFMGSEFSHAALVFFVPQPEENLDNAFLLESVSSGVGLANMSSYVARRSGTDLVVLRLEGEGFDEAYFKRVRGLMLDHVKSGYDYSQIIRIGLSLLFGVRLVGSRIRKGKDMSMQEAVHATKRRRMKWLPPQFICSGFIQYGFVEALLREDGDPEPALFNDRVSVSDNDALLAVTPQDIATSPKLSWKFALRNGRVHKISTAVQGLRIISGGK